MSQLTIKNMGKNISFYFLILITSSLGFMHPRVAFFESGDLTEDMTFKSHMEKDADFSVKLVKTLTNFIERKISEIPGVSYVSTISSRQNSYSKNNILTYHKSLVVLQSILML